MTVYVIHPCVGGCFCRNQCNVRDTLEILRASKPEMNWICSKDRTSGSIIQQIGDALDVPNVKIVVLWNSFCKEQYETRMARDEALFLYEVEQAEFCRADRSIGNCLIHVAVERKAVPVAIIKWETPVSVRENFVSTLMERIKEHPLDQKDLSPCGDIGVGLAYTFFAKYLKKILHPEDDSQTVKLMASAKELNAESCMCKALITVIPRSGITPDNMPEGMEAVSCLEDLSDTGGVIRRSYKRTIYKIQDDQQDYYAAVEFATPVRAMFAMKEGFWCDGTQGPEAAHRRPSIAGMSEYWLQQEIKIFTSNLKNLCRENLSPEERAQLIFIEFNDLRFGHRAPEAYDSNKELGNALKHDILRHIKANLLP